jgi:hypothetical protein
LGETRHLGLTGVETFAEFGMEENPRGKSADYGADEGKKQNHAGERGAPGERVKDRKSRRAESLDEDYSRRGR